MDSESDLETMVIKRTYEERKEDLVNILYVEKPFSADQIQIQWTNYLELIIEPVGWRAVWKMSRDICLQFNTVFPTIAVVMVENVNFENLTARVKISAVDDRVTELPDTVEDVPLIQLHPTIKQEYSNLNVDRTADALENMRFFYNHLWYPWDADEDSPGNWISEHLENRLKLNYEVVSRAPEVLSKIRTLIQTGRNVFDKIKEYLLLEEKGELKEQDVAELGELYSRLGYVKENLTFLENSNLRVLAGQKCRDAGKQQILLAWLDGISDDLITVMQQIKSTVSQEKNQSFRSSPSLQKLLNEMSHGDSLFVGPGVHALKSCSEFGTEIALQGVVEDTDKTIISDSEEGLSLLDVVSKEIFFSNLTFSGSKIQFLLAVRFGKCKMSNVKILGKGKTVGIFVQSGAEFYAENCTFTGCSIAIEADNGSNVVLKNCTFSNNMEGLVFQSTRIDLQNCSFLNNAGCALMSLASKNNSSPLLQRIDGGIEILESLPDFKASKCIFNDNKVDVIKR